MLNTYMLHSVIVTAKSSKKMKGDSKINEIFHKLKRVYRDCMKKNKRQDKDIQFTA